MTNEGTIESSIVKGAAPVWENAANCYPASSNVFYYRSAI